ncbi:hypothetical protein EJV47_11810 [Hymenobacter gummosus]|uniref:Uncharacterized protein n=1 Tax=Hymenobacter gummosus TaxID=1776032 RepID=A0A431U3U3_9BACT|nr:hypothetical protein [Hymenobacter gummosus]RTQ50303.1 hypothetical protein EJV47_11810 [Hymenobacter gummosus]
MPPRFTRFYFRLMFLAAGLLLLAAPAARAQHPVIQRIHDTADESQDSVFKLGSTITLEVTGLGQWMEAEEANLVKRGFDPQKAHQKSHSLVLYIDDAPLIGLPPLAVYADETAAPDSSIAAASDSTLVISSTGDAATGPGDDDPIAVRDKVIFKLVRTPDNYRYWDIVYDSPWDYSHPGKIGLGYEDRVFTELYPNHPNNVRLELIQPSSLWVAGIGTGLLALGILLLAHRSWMLREWETKPSAAAYEQLAANGTLTPPFSLAKTQLAFWTFLIMSCYLVIYCVTGEMTNISMTTLSLLGISAGTTGISGLLDVGDKAKLQANEPLRPSRGFLADLLSDEQGVSINRLQKVVITLLLGYFFVRTVYKTVALPEWDNNETLLLAISSATYLGLKWQGQKQDNAALGSAGLPSQFAAPGTPIMPSGAAPVYPAPTAPVYGAPAAPVYPPPAPAAPGFGTAPPPPMPSPAAPAAPTFAPPPAAPVYAAPPAAAGAYAPPASAPAAAPPPVPAQTLPPMPTIAPPPPAHHVVFDLPPPDPAGSDAPLPAGKA